MLYLLDWGSLLNIIFPVIHQVQLRYTHKQTVGLSFILLAWLRLKPRLRNLQHLVPPTEREVSGTGKGHTKGHSRKWRRWFTELWAWKEYGFVKLERRVQKDFKQNFCTNKLQCYVSLDAGSLKSIKSVSMILQVRIIPTSSSVWYSSCMINDSSSCFLDSLQHFDSLFHSSTFSSSPS